jgi:SAM-dependent methyltransferase
MIVTRGPIARAYPEANAGGFTRWDGTVQFYSRVNALLQPQMLAIDLGAGRGALHEGPDGYAKRLAGLKGKVGRVIGVDVDPVVARNRGVDGAVVYDGRRLPFRDASIDLVLADYAFEHIGDPENLAGELTRTVRAGGWICARTPYAWSALVAVSRVIPNPHHANTLRRLQPERQAIDVFPAYYKMNSNVTINRLFPSGAWENYNYTWSPEPSYHANSSFILFVQRLYQWMKFPLFGGEVLMIFMRRKG